MKSEPSPGDTIVVWFSNGAASAVAAHETLRRYGATCDVRIVNNPVIEEDEDNLRFQEDVGVWLDRKIILHTNPKWPTGSANDVWRKERAMSFPFGAPCTRGLKKEARQDFERNNKIDWHVFGFTVDEKKRHDRFVLTERSNVLSVLIDANLTKDDCARVLMSNGLTLPRVYAEGYPNANCIGCVKAASPTYWNLVRRTRPEVFKQRAELSRELGVRLALVKGNRVFLDELSPDAVGRPLKTMNMECGVFCEEGGVKEKPPRIVSLAKTPKLLEYEPVNNFGVAVAGGGDKTKRSENDFYGTPPEPTQALIDRYRDVIPDVVAELACGRGHMARVIAANGFTVLSSDRYHKGFGFGGVDFLELPKLPAWTRMGFITNPPFFAADDFITHAHELGFPFIAMYLKATYWNADKRHKLWKKHPPKACHPLTWRVDFTGGGAATMDCQWVIWGDSVSFSNEPLRRPM